MAQLTVRNVSDEVVAALKARARSAGRSAEAEHRRILEEALHAPPAGRDFFAAAKARRVRLAASSPDTGAPDTGALLRQDRDRHEP